jgi:hypothetical protein
MVLLKVGVCAGADSGGNTSKAVANVSNDVSTDAFKHFDTLHLCNMLLGDIVCLTGT